MSIGFLQAVESADFLFLINSLDIAFASLDELATDLPPTPDPPLGLSYLRTSTDLWQRSNSMAKVKVRWL